MDIITPTADKEMLKLLDRRLAYAKEKLPTVADKPEQYAEISAYIEELESFKAYILANSAPSQLDEATNEMIAKARIDIGNDDIDDAYMDVNYAISRDTDYTLKEFVKESSLVNKSFQKTEDFTDPKAHDELKPGEWYEVEGTLYQIADRQPIDNEIQAFKVLPDYSIGQGTHAFAKTLFKPDKFKFVDKKEKLTNLIRDKEAQIAQLKQEINALKEVLATRSESKENCLQYVAETMKAPELIQVTPTRFYDDIAKGGLEHKSYKVLKSTDCYELQEDTDSHTVALCTILLDPRQDMSNPETISFEPCSVVVGTLSDTKHSVLGWHVVHGTTCMIDFALDTPLDVIAELTNIYFSHFIEPVTVDLLQKALDLYHSAYADEMTESVAEAKDTEFIDFPRSELPDETADMLLDISTLEQGIPVIEAEDYRNLYNELKEDFNMDAMQSLELDLGNTHTKLMNHEAKALRIIYEE